MLDRDNFKRYNDCYGHLVGDDLLRALGSLIRNSVRQADIAARYGGEEFAIILPETGPEKASALAKRLWRRIREHTFAVCGQDTFGQITVSMGIATYPVHAQDRESLIQAADVALLEAKRKGKDQVNVYYSEYNRRTDA